MQCGPLVYPCRIWYMKVLFLRETKLYSFLHNKNLFIEPAFDLFILSFTETEKIRRFCCVCSM